MDDVTCLYLTLVIVMLTFYPLKQNMENQSQFPSRSDISALEEEVP
jgi:hypothetical protein